MIIKLTPYFPKLDGSKSYYLLDISKPYEIDLSRDGFNIIKYGYMSVYGLDWHYATDWLMKESKEDVERIIYEAQFNEQFNKHIEE